MEGRRGTLQGRTCCSTFPPQPSCLPLPGTEIAIVLDGSGSIDPPDFQRAKDFISNMMRSFSKCFEVGFPLLTAADICPGLGGLRGPPPVCLSSAVPLLQGNNPGLNPVHASPFQVSQCITFADIPLAKIAMASERNHQLTLSSILMCPNCRFPFCPEAEKNKWICPLAFRGSFSGTEMVLGMATLPIPLSPTSPLQCNFALVQYGFDIQTEFDLRDSQDIIASLARVQNITQVKKVTKTASAIQHVL